MCDHMYLGAVWVGKQLVGDDGGQGAGKGAGDAQQHAKRKGAKAVVIGAVVALVVAGGDTDNDHRQGAHNDSDPVVDSEHS